MAHSGHPGKIGGEQAAKNSSLAGGGLGGGGSGSGKNAGGMTQTLLNNKYPGAAKKKNKAFDMTAGNMLEVAKMAGSILGGPIGSAVSAADTAYGAITDTSDPLNPFEGPKPDVPSVGAGFAEGASKDQKTSSGLTAKTLAANKKKKVTGNPLSSLVGTLLSGSGGTLVLG